MVYVMLREYIPVNVVLATYEANFCLLFPILDLTK